MTEVIKPGYYVQLIEEGREGDYFRVTTVEPFEYEINGGGTDEFTDSVAASGTSGYKNITNLEPDDRPRRLFQVHMGVQNQGEYKIKNPPGTNRWGVDADKDAGSITNIKSPFWAPNPKYEIWLVQNYYPSINCINNDADNGIYPWLRFTGYKYDIELVTEPKIINYIKANQLKHRKIVLGGVRPG